MLLEREIELVNTFVLPEKRERYIGFLSSEKRRKEFLNELYHFRDFDPTCEVPLSGPADSAEGLLADLRRRGAGDACYVISVNRELDGITRPLAAVISEVFALVEGTIVSCVPACLAYYEGEAPKNRCILDGRGRPTHR
jgi:hypothetical protein